MYLKCTLEEFTFPDNIGPKLCQLRFVTDVHYRSQIGEPAGVTSMRPGGRPPYWDVSAGSPFRKSDRIEHELEEVVRVQLLHELRRNGVGCHRGHRGHVEVHQLRNHV